MRRVRNVSARDACLQPNAGPEPDPVRGFLYTPEVIVTSIDGDLYATYWTTAEAADAVGVEPGVIRVWAHRGHLKRVNGSGRPLYRAIDVMQAERSTRERARRTYAAA